MKILHIEWLPEAASVIELATLSPQGDDRLESTSAPRPRRADAATSKVIVIRASGELIRSEIQVLPRRLSAEPLTRRVVGHSLNQTCG